MLVWLVTIGEPLPTDPGKPRLLRAGLLAQILDARGHQVIWWTSAFDHMQKIFRTTGERTQSVGERQTLVLLNGGGYKRNISLTRIRDHRRVADSFSRRARSMPRPDLIVVSLPTVELAAAAVRYARAHTVPVVVDVRDLWPDAMVDLLPPLARPIGRLLAAPLTRQVRQACSGATAITAHAPMFVEWGLKHAGRSAHEFDRVFPFGYPTTHLAQEDRHRAVVSLGNKGVDLSPQRITAVYVGTIGNQPELDPVVEAAALLREDNRIQFVIAGTGGRSEYYSRLAEQIPNLVTPGWIDRAEIRVLLEHAMAGLLPYPPRRDWLETIPNKMPEYLSAGLPLMVSLKSGRMLDFARQNECGISYGHSPAVLARTLTELADSAERRLALKKAASIAFEHHFRADVVYGEMADYLETLVKVSDRTTHAHSALG